MWLLLWHECLVCNHNILPIERYFFPLSSYSGQSTVWIFEEWLGFTDFLPFFDPESTGKVLGFLLLCSCMEIEIISDGHQCIILSLSCPKCHAVHVILSQASQRIYTVSLSFCLWRSFTFMSLLVGVSLLQFFLSKTHSDALINMPSLSFVLKTTAAK